MIEEIVSKAIDVGQDKLQGEAKEEKTTFGGGVLRFVVSIIWFVVALAVSLAALIAMVGQGMSDIFGGESKTLGTVAICASLLVGIITFCVPYLRKKGSATRWFGIVCLGDAAWWLYLMATGF